MLTYTDRALDELADADDRYHRVGVGAKFLRALDAAETRVAADPTSLPLQPGDDRIRRCRIHGFPYDLLFDSQPGGPVVVSVWHLHRNPADRPA